MRRRTYISYAVLQNCINQLMIRRWLELVEDCDQRKFATTEKGMVFLQKYAEVQEILGLMGKRKLKKAYPQLQMVMINQRQAC